MGKRRTKKTGSTIASNNWRTARGRFVARLFEDPTLPKLRDFDLNVAIDYLKIDGEKEKNALKEKLQSVARDYWELRQDIVDRPPAAWYRDKLNAVEKAAKDLLSLLKEDSGTSLATLESTFARQLNWQLRRRSLAPNAHPSAPNRQPSLEEILEWVLIGCGRSVIKTRGARGNKTT